MVVVVFLDFGFEGCLELFKKCDLDHDCEKVHLDRKIDIKELSAK